MTMARWQSTIVDAQGNIVPNATITVRNEGTGILAAVKSNRAGTTAKANPFVADEHGFAFAYLVGGSYRVTATKGDFSAEWRHVAVGRAAETDLTLAVPKSDWSSETEYNTGDYVFHEGYIFISLVDENTDNEPDHETPGSSTEWMFAGTAAEGPQGLPGAGDRADIMLSISGLPQIGEQILRGEMAFNGEFVEARSRASAEVASTGTAVFSAALNGTPFATITFTESDAGVVEFIDDPEFEPGDILTLDAPSPRDGTLADISITLAADRGSDIDDLDDGGAAESGDMVRAIRGSGLVKITLGGAAGLDVGTSAGTVAAGDDARLSDAREWTAETVSQEEAEAGTETIARKWTALRVGQAIAALAPAASSGTFDENILITVGSGGDFATMPLALKEASRWRPLYTGSQVMIEIRQLTGFELEDELLFHNIDMRHVVLTSVDAVVPADVAGNLLHGFDAHLPRLQCMYDMDESGGHGIVLENSSVWVIGTNEEEPDVGVVDAGLNGLHSIYQGRFAVTAADFGGAQGHGLFANHASRGAIGSSDFSGCGQAGGTDSQNGLPWAGVLVRHASSANLSGTDFRLSGGSGTSTNDIRVSYGGIIEITSCLGDVSQSINTLTDQGIIFEVD